jgi:hypothetical protein
MMARIVYQSGTHLKHRVRGHVAAGMLWSAMVSAFLIATGIVSGCAGARGRDVSSAASQASRPATRPADGSRVSVSIVSDADPAVDDLSEHRGFVALMGDTRGGMLSFFGRVMDHDGLLDMTREIGNSSLNDDVKIQLSVVLKEKEVVMSDIALALNRLVAAFKEAFPDKGTLHIFITSSVFRPGWPGE